MGDNTEQLIIELYKVLAWFSTAPHYEPDHCFRCASWWDRREAVMAVCMERWA